MTTNLAWRALLLVAGTFLLFLGACVAGGGYVESGAVYGGFGYSAPVFYDEPWYGAGGVYVHPPFGRDDHRDDHQDTRRDERPRNAEPDRPRSAPVEHRAPSIPDRPRPATRRAGESDKDHHR